MVISIGHCSDFDGLKKVTFDSVANEFGLLDYSEHACHHLNAYVDSSAQAFLLVNSPKNNIDVYKVVPAARQGFKS